MSLDPPFFHLLNWVLLNCQIFNVCHLICYQLRGWVRLPSALLYQIEKSFQYGQENRKCTNHLNVQFSASKAPKNRKRTSTNFEISSNILRMDLMTEIIVIVKLDQCGWVLVCG